MKFNVIVIALLLIYCVVSTVLIVRFGRQASEAKGKYENILAQRKMREQIALKEAKAIIRKIDTASITHFISQIADPVPAEDIPLAGLIDTTGQALGIKNRQLKDVTQLLASVRADSVRMARIIKNQSQIIYTFSDKYLSLKFTPPQGLDTVGSADFAYNLKLGVTKYKSKSWFLGRSKNFIDVYSEDPRITINGIKTFSVEEHKPYFGMQIGPAAQIFWNKNFVNFGVGASANIQLGNFRMNGGRYFNPDTKHWFNQATVSFSLINSR